MRWVWLAAPIFNIGGNVKFPIAGTTERVFRKVWEMTCLAGFLNGREAARVMQTRGRGTVLFTGATAITLADVDGRSVPIRLRDGLARLLSPYL